METLEKKPEQGTDTSDGGIVAVTSKKSRKKRVNSSQMTGRQKLIMLVVAFIGILMVSGVALFIYSQLGEEPPKVQATGERQYDEAANKINLLRLKKDFAGAVTVADNFLKTDAEKKYKVSMAGLKGGALEEQGDCNGAIKAYAQAEEIKGAPDHGMSYGIARCAERIGDKALAIENYKKAVADLEKINEPALAMDKDYMEVRLAALEAQ